MPDFAYRYELRRGDEVIATGYMTRERSLDVGERVTIGADEGTVRSIEPLLGEADYTWSCSSREKASALS